MDLYFTSVPLAKWHSENNFTIVGTMMLDRIGLPNEIKTMEGREEKSTKYLYQKDGDALLASNVDKKIWEKNIVVLSTMHSVSVLRKMSEKNLTFIRFMITQKWMLCG